MEFAKNMTRDSNGLKILTTLLIAMYMEFTKKMTRDSNDLKIHNLLGYMYGSHQGV